MFSTFAGAAKPSLLPELTDHHWVSHNQFSQAAYPSNITLHLRWVFWITFFTDCFSKTRDRFY
jgi:hypothetical protein